MDNITGRTSCELVTPVKNKLIMVAYGVAEQPTQSQTLHSVEIPSRGYAKVGVERVVDSWDDLELEIPRGDGGKNLGEAIHGWILWHKLYIRITQPNPPTLETSPQGLRLISPTPSTRAPSPLPDRDPSMSPPPERDPSMSPPPSPMSMATRRKAPSVPPIAATKKKQLEDPPVDKGKIRAFIRSVEAERRKHPEKPPFSNYDRQITKASKKRKKNTYLTTAQLRREDHIPKHPRAAKWKYEYGKLLMYKLHQWYMQASAEGFAVLEVRIDDQHFFRGEDIINVLLEELYFLFNQDALDKSLISCWVLMEIQTCRRKAYYHVGFMDPDVVNESTLRDKPNRILKNIYKFLDNQHYHKYIILLYNFKFHWILILVVPDMSFVYVFDSLRKPKQECNDIIDAMNKTWARFRRNHVGEFKEELHWKTDFLEPVNNLCGYYVCEFIHGFMMYRKERVLDTDCIRAVQEQLCGFLLDEVINPTREFHNDGSNLHHRQDSGSE
uniref:Uncharacterized protein n=1 Tax=Setaria viridis TaxID=4556 RepID=A0A4U6TLZ2_SETVI|nr:hypothetical protein SEVIR_7G050700v2 [Setaria viridis]